MVYNYPEDFNNFFLKQEQKKNTGYFFDFDTFIFEVDVFQN